MTDQWFNRYARITPIGIAVAVVVGYLIAGGVWWGIFIVAAIAAAYAAFRVGLARRIVQRINRRMSKNKP